VGEVEAAVVAAAVAAATPVVADAAASRVEAVAAILG
jgi:hypothetical protein